ncbi:hypothetical protein LTR35_013192 [Friedmanniomyces endolithicus]|nr:hypothetical protein LTR35_013192 [Friedmanniomyces endolithicus]KAK0298470.1 hypothetical protein LTS00_002850 [Friedmanniomyces endolithicus]KAK0989394.1 hypothetical protein LTR54_012513 [Friedmanniomyces endolithicus]
MHSDARHSGAPRSPGNNRTRLFWKRYQEIARGWGVSSNVSPWNATSPSQRQQVDGSSPVLHPFPWNMTSLASSEYFFISPGQRQCLPDWLHAILDARSEQCAESLFTRKRANLNTGKCDKLQPCGSCDRAGVPCIYTDRTKERKYNADHVERLEKRIRQAEARNKSLADELSRVRANPDAVPGSLTGDQKPLRSHAKTPDAVSEISYLAINAAGERQPYLGSTSGVLFAELICSSVRVGVPADLTPVTSLAGGPESGGIVSTAHLATVPRRFDDLPPHTLAQELVSAYLNHENIIYPFIYPHALLGTLEKVYAEEGYYVSRASLFEVFVLNMVFAIASAHVAKFDRQL